MALRTVKVVFSGEAVEVPEATLTLSSPVFRAMLSSGMQEASKGLVELPGKCRAEFEVFAQFLDPRSLLSAKVDGGNVDFLLEWGDEYDVPQVKQLCEEYLLTQPASVPRLLQANKCQLQRQRKRCIKEVALNFEEHAVEQVLEEPGILAELLPKMKKRRQQEKKERQQEKADLLHLKKERAREKARARRLRERLQALPEEMYDELPEECVMVDGRSEGIDELVMTMLQQKVEQLAAEMQ